MSTDQGAVQFERDPRLGLVVGDRYNDRAIVEPVLWVLLAPEWCGHGGASCPKPTKLWPGQRSAV